MEYQALSTLRKNSRNPKGHVEESINASIDRLGFIEPVVIDGRTGTLISGHGRLNALRQMRTRGENPPEGIRETENDWLIPVVTGWSSRNDQEAGAALIALNRTVELGGWDDEKLLALLDDLSDSPDGLIGVGYAEHELDELRDKLNDAATAPTTQASSPDAFECPNCGWSPGDW